VKNILAKKSLGQHFLNNSQKAEEIVGFLEARDASRIIEIGPGMGVLSQFILKRCENCQFIEIDKEAVDYLTLKYPDIKGKIIHRDFLKIKSDELDADKIAIIGNFPYNISSQILFKVLENRHKIIEVVGMFQKEVAERVISAPGSRVYGILSVLIQAYYQTELKMELGPGCFSPPPKVHSSVIRLKRNSVEKLECDEQLFYKIVKLTFNQRRKMIRNSIKMIGVSDNFTSEFITYRPEQLGVGQFVDLTNQVSANHLEMNANKS
jgi:16S rRNA (adenine1518-N6/adenine1519-N6)-dimethyltransferase